MITYFEFLFLKLVVLLLFREKPFRPRDHLTSTRALFRIVAYYQQQKGSNLLLLIYRDDSFELHTFSQVVTGYIKVQEGFHRSHDDSVFVFHFQCF